MLRDLLRSTVPRSFATVARRLRARVTQNWTNSSHNADNTFTATIMYHPPQQTQQQQHPEHGAIPSPSSLQNPFFISVDFAPAEVRSILDSTDFDLFEFHSPTANWRHLPPPPRSVIQKSAWGAPPAATVGSHLPPTLVHNFAYHMTLAAMTRPGEYSVPRAHLDVLYGRNVAHGAIVARSVVITDAIAAVQLELVSPPSLPQQPSPVIISPASSSDATPSPPSAAAAGSASLIDAATLAAATFNRHPHVTLGLDRRRGIKAAYSNAMLELLENAACSAGEASAASAASASSLSESATPVSVSPGCPAVAAKPRTYANATAFNGGARYTCPVGPAREQLPLFEPLRVAVLRTPVVLKSGVVVPH